MLSILVYFSQEGSQKEQESNFFPTPVVGFVKSFVSGVTSGLLYVVIADLDIGPLGFQARITTSLSYSSLWWTGFLLRKWGSVPGDADQASQQS